MIDWLGIVETDKVNHIVETDIVKLVVKIKSFSMSFDEFDKETRSSDGLQPMQVDLSYVHALSELHLHEIHVVLNPWRLSDCLPMHRPLEGTRSTLDSDLDKTFVRIAFWLTFVFQVAFCLGLRFTLEALRFVSEDLAFCLRRPCVLSQKTLCFVSEDLAGPYKPITVLVQAVDATNDSSAIIEHTTVKTPMNMSPENKAHFESEKEAIHLILTGIRDKIYSTVDACQTAQEMWEAIKRLQQGESLNIQDVKTNLFWEFGKFTSHDGETIESYYTIFYKLMNEMIRNNLTVAMMQVNVQFLQQLQQEWSRFVTIVKQHHKLDEVSYHKLFDILKQYQKEVNELHAERLARNTNPLALVTTAQANQDPYYQTSKFHKSYAPSPKLSIPTRSHTTTRHKGKEIAKPITPPSETASVEDIDPEQAQRDKDMHKNLALIKKYFKKIYKPTNNNLRTSSNLRNKNVDTTPWYKNDNESGQFGNQRTVNVAGDRENVGSLVVQQSGIQCFNYKEFGHFAKECRKPKRYDWLADTNEEIDEQELEAHYSYMAKIQEHSEQSKSVSNTCLVETDDSNVVPDSPDMCNDDIQNDKNDVKSDDERVTLANLIANLKLDVDENKKIQKQLKKANTTLS
nr:hypothetical protein [Tanacetum cinerariifolium]